VLGIEFTRKTVDTHQMPRFPELLLEIRPLRLTVDGAFLRPLAISTPPLDIVVLIMFSIADTGTRVRDAGDGWLDLVVFDASPNYLLVVGLDQIRLDLE
jgi:hypothetical protein